MVYFDMFSSLRLDMILSLQMTALVSIHFSMLPSLANSSFLQVSIVVIFNKLGIIRLYIQTYRVI